MKDDKSKPAFKQEHMTILSGSVMVSKTHGRIVFRGKIDTLQAELIEAQVLAAELCEEEDSAESEICRSLGEVLDFLRALMAAEVKESPLPPPSLFGMDAEDLHRQSHNTGKVLKVNQLPSHTQGKLAARLNLLRTKVREAELLAVKVFGPPDNFDNTETDDTKGTKPREDIILALNRLSSALWFLYCKYLSRKL